jgi:small redox-active disulfide protein 2
MEIKVLGSGCSKCRSLLATVQEVVSENGIDAVITKVDDIVKIMEYHVLRTPALVVDGKIVSEGKVLSKTEIRQELGIRN